MIGERENIFNETEYGSLVMRPYSISGNDIDAFYDANGNLVFVLDKMLSDAKPNVLLVINPDGDKKWDEILSGTYGVDLESVRPKVDNKYQKFDIEYSGLDVYDNLLKTYMSGDGVEDNLMQLSVLRNSAARHSAMIRLNVANETITKTKATIIKTKESIVRLETKLKTLRDKLSDLKGEVGRVAPKQSAAKILKTESQIESTQEKIKRANKRLESAEKRLETATIDAKLASDLLNQPSLEIKQPTRNKPMIVMPNHEANIDAPDNEVNNKADIIKADIIDESGSSSDEEEVAEEIDERPQEHEDVNVVEEIQNEPQEHEEIKDDKVDDEELSDDIVFGDDGEMFDYDKESEEETDDIKKLDDEDNKNSTQKDNLISEPSDIQDSEQTDDNDSEQNDIKPLLDKDPEIIDEDIAFKPIDFNVSDDVSEMAVPAPVFSNTSEFSDSDEDGEKDVVGNSSDKFDDRDDSELIDNDGEKSEQSRPVLESLTPIMDEPLVAEPIIDENNTLEEIQEEKPLLNLSEEKTSNVEKHDTQPDVDVFDSSNLSDSDTINDTVPAPVDDGYRPVSPVIMSDADVVVAEYDDSGSGSKSPFVYFLLLLILIGLSVFALWLYQKKFGNIKPFFSGSAPDVVNVSEPEPIENKVIIEEPADVQQIESENVSVDNTAVVQNLPQKSPEPVVEDAEPVVMNAVSSKISSFSNTLNVGEKANESTNVNVDKPAYDTGEKHEEMFVYETENPEDAENDEEYSEPVIYYPVPEQRIQYSETYFQDDNPFVDYVDQDDTQVEFVQEFTEEYNTDNSDVDYVDGWDNPGYIHDGGMAYEEEYDAEEAAYQAGDDGYDEYR